MVVTDAKQYVLKHLLISLISFAGSIVVLLQYIRKNIAGFYIMLITPLLLEMMPSTATAIGRDGPFVIKGTFVRNWGFDMDKEKYLAQKEENMNYPITRSMYNKKLNEQPGLSQNYAQSIDNDLKLFDMSDESIITAQKRGLANNGCLLPNNAPCSCQSSTPNVLFFRDHYPNNIQNVICIPELCRPPYKCQERIYKQQVLRIKSHPKELSAIELPRELERNWVAIEVPVIIGCVCKKEY